VAEAASMDQLVLELEKIIPALITENHVKNPSGRRVDYHIVAHIKNSIDIPGLA
jgi:hypothetical protein